MPKHFKGFVQTQQNGITNDICGPDYLTAEMLFEAIVKKHRTTRRPSIIRWSEDIKKLRKSRNVSHEVLRDLISFIAANSNAEWMPIVRSPSTLDVKFDSVMRAYDIHRQTQTVTLHGIEKAIRDSDPIKLIYERLEAKRSVGHGIRSTVTNFKACAVTTQEINMLREQQMNLFKYHVPLTILTLSVYDFSWDWWSFVAAEKIVKRNWKHPLGRYTFIPDSPLTHEFLIKKYGEWYMDDERLIRNWTEFLHVLHRV